MAQMVKHLPVMRETWVRSLGQEEKEMATHSSILAWEIPWTGSLVGYSPWGRKGSMHLSDFIFTFHSISHFSTKGHLFFIPLMKTIYLSPKAMLPLETVAKVGACGPLGFTQCYDNRLLWSPWANLGT